MVGGLAPGHSTGPSGLQLESSVVSVPEPSSGLQDVAAVLALLALLAWRRGRVRS
jgi:MYXO-CTERM domain-containing protein